MPRVKPRGRLRARPRVRPPPPADLRAGVPEQAEVAEAAAGSAVVGQRLRPQQEPKT